jgi:predicted GIY-YIG superfamily endonuclease
MPKLSKSEMEVIISKAADESEWCVYVSDPSALAYYVGLAEKVGGRVVQHQGGTKVFLPEDSVLLQVRRKLNLSLAQRAERAEQMKARRAVRPARNGAPA